MFQSCSNLTSVTIGNNLTNIGDWAFSYCPKLAAVGFRGNAPSFGQFVLYGDTRATIYYELGTTGWDTTFEGRPTALWDSDASCGYTTNNGTIAITKYIGSGATATIPSTINGLPVMNIGDSAFQSCISLTSVEVPNSVTNIGFSAFSLCTSLTAITVDAGNTVYSSVDGVLFDKSQSTLIQYPSGKPGSYTIPSSVISIGSEAFQSSTSLTSVYIPDSVTSIGNSAFSGCTSLTSAEIPNSVTNIGGSAFYACTTLTAITVDAGNTVYSSVDGVLFDQSQSTLIQYPEGKAGSYTVPTSVTSIASSAFRSCSTLTIVNIPNSIISIGSGAFSGCTSLGAVTIPDSVTNIGGSAFSGCTSVSAVTIGSKVTSLGYRVFSGCTSLTNLTIGNSVSNIGDWAFQSCSNLTSVTIPNSVTNIGNYAFRYCTLLTSVTIGDSVTNIGVYAFSGCASLSIVTIPNSVANIGQQAFNSCISLTGVFFQGNCPSLGASVFYNDKNTTVYYLLGTTGWGTTFGGRPTALWQPEIQASDARFGVQTNQFGFNIAWASGQVVVVEAATNLANLIWLPLQTNTLTADTLYFSDPGWTNYPGRFYRLRSP